MACSSRCTSGPHATYGACLRAKGIHVADPVSHAVRLTRDSEVKQYVDARNEGMQPETIFKRDVDHARFMSKQLGEPFRADAPVSQLAAAKE